MVDNSQAVAHDNNIHQGIDRTVARLNLMGWQDGCKDVNAYINRCIICDISKEKDRTPIIERGSLVVTKPLELVVLAFVTIDESS